MEILRIFTNKLEYCVRAQGEGKSNYLQHLVSRDD